MLISNASLKQAFTLIEILIVIALLGALAIGLVGTLDPMEQIKKGGDSAKLQTSTDFYNAIVQSYAIRGTANVTSTIQGAALSSQEVAPLIDSLKKAGELKKDYSGNQNANLDKIYLSASTDGKSFSVCFRPDSKSFQAGQNAQYDQRGVKSDCNGSGCYICVGDVVPSQNGSGENSNTSQGSTATCKSLNAECEINNSEKICCANLTCVPNNAQSENGKCQLAPTATPTPTQAPTPTPTPASTCNPQTITVPFTKGSWGVYTTYTYSDCVHISMSGTGQSSGLMRSDAFYIYTDSNGVPRTPENYPVWFFGGILCVNGTLCINNDAPQKGIPGGALPPYNPDHVYDFTYCLTSPTKIRFASGDVYTPDNTGAYQAQISCVQ